MRYMFLFLAFFFGIEAGLAFGAPKAPTAQAQQAQPQPNTNPDPFGTKTVNIPPGNPVTVTLPPPVVLPTDNTPQYLWMMIITALGAFLGIPQFKQAFGSGHPVALDDVKAAAEGALVDLIQSGKLAPLVQTGLGQIPVIGGLASGAEPMIRKVLLELLQQHGLVTSPAQQTTTPPIVGDLLSQIEKIIDAKLKEKQA